jgi:hypothetical protein
MDYYYKELDKLLEEFHEVMHDYSLFKEDIDQIEEKDIKEINELLEKNDEFYLKKAISKLKDLINYIKTTSISINKEYSRFSDLAKKWEKVELPIMDDKELDRINNQVFKANNLIKSHNLDDLKEANKIMEELIKMAK